MKFLSNLSVRQKVWGSFGILLALIVLISAVSYRSLFQVEDEFRLVVEQLQPTMLASQDLSQSLSESAAALDLYLLAKEEANKVEYRWALARVDGAITHLQQQVGGCSDESLKDALGQLNTLMTRFTSYEKKMITLVENDMANLAGVYYAAQNLNPLSQQILQITGEMLMSEYEEETNTRRRGLLNEIHQLRYA